MEIIKILNLYAGIGGNRKLWPDEITINNTVYKLQITAIEINPKIAKVYQDFFPNDKVIVTDAHQYLLEHFKEFDFIWSSPPCPTHSKMQKTFVYSEAPQNKNRRAKYPDMKLYQEIILLMHFFKGRYCVENVQGYYDPLIEPQIIGRHYFWSNFKLKNVKIKKIKNFIKDAKYKDLQRFLGINIKTKIYEKNNHDYRNILRNCVHPEIGLAILQKALNIQVEENIPQGKLFS